MNRPTLLWAEAAGVLAEVGVLAGAGALAVAGDHAADRGEVEEDIELLLETCWDECIRANMVPVVARMAPMEDRVAVRLVTVHPVAALAAATFRTGQVVAA